MRGTRVFVAAASVSIAAILGVPSAAASIAQPAVVIENPVNYTPNVVDGGGIDHTEAYAVAQLGDTTYVGGTFALVQPPGGSTVSRSNIVAFSATTGALTSFAPSIDGPVWAIATDGTSLYVGGQFTTVNGVSHRALVKLNPTTGAVDTSFNANFKSGKVTEVRLVNGRLIVGGGVPGHLLALNPATGADTGYINLDIAGSVASNAGATDVYRFAVNPGQTRLVALGNFLTVNGQVRARAFMADLGPASATLDPWYYQRLTRACRATKIPQQLRDVDFSPDGSYFVFVASGYIPQSGGLGLDVCDAAARFETNVASPSAPTWIHYTGGDSLYSVAAGGAAVYVQGHQRWMDNTYGNNSAGPGAVDRPGIAALDSNSGLALSWNPGKTRANGGRDLLATPAGLWVASDGARFDGELHDNIAFCPLP
jgi:hypothetical protein